MSLFLSFPLKSNVDTDRSWFVAQNWRIPPQNGNLLLRFEKLNSKIILSLRIELIERSILIVHSDSWIFCRIISPLVPMSPLVGLQSPSKIPSLCHSAALCLRHLSLFCPRYDSRRRSLVMLVLSHPDTQHYNRHMVGCGCHEILIPSSTTVLFSITFLLISISRVEGEGEFISVV